MDAQTEIHNKLAGQVVRAIVTPPLEAGGGPSDVLVVLESVVLGVLLTVAPGHEARMLDAVVERVKQRVNELHLMASPAEGTA